MDDRTGEERMDAAWGRLESPENRDRRLSVARVRRSDSDAHYVCAYPGCDVMCASLDDIMSEHPAT